MRSLRLLTAIAVLACSALAWADNLPPVPKSEIKIVTPTPAVEKVVEVSASMPSAPVPVADKISDKDDAESAPLPPTCESCAKSAKSANSVKSAKSEKSEKEKFKHAVKDAGCQIDDQVRTCKRASVSSIKFVANEFLGKPIYAVEKASLDAEGERLCREECRLNKQSERLAAEADRLAEKIKEACPNDLHAKFKLLKEQAAYADEANENAVRRAKLELKQSEYCQRKSKLEAKYEKLFPAK